MTKTALMTPVLLTTRLKVADPTALTALSTLRMRLDLTRIAGLSREEVFLFEVDTDRAAATGIVEDIVRRTNLFQNPNKHIVRIRTGEDREAKGPEAWVLIWTPGDGDEYREALWRHAGAANVTAVRRAWFWKYVPALDAGRDSFLRQVEDSLVLRSREHGFLVNPAYQESRLYEGRPTVYDTWEALATGRPTPEES